MCLKAHRYNDSMVPWFIATERFTPEDKSWAKYIEWSGLTQLKEVITLDTALCPTVLPEIKDEYWPHIVNENFLTRFFLDFDFLSRQVQGIAKKNVLCVFRNPAKLPPVPSAENFQFLGYDLLDDTSTSALTNCGGFPDTFANSELSEFGLLTEFDRAREVQARLRLLHPKDPHANCDLWAIFRAAE